MASLFSALKNTLLLVSEQQNSPPVSEDVALLQTQKVLSEIQAGARFAEATLQRAKWTPYLNLSRQLTGLERDTLLRGGPLTWEYIEKTGIPLLIRLSSTNVQDIATRLGRAALLKQLREFTLALKRD